MASRKPQPGLSEAAEKTRDVIRGLQSRLQVETAAPEPSGESVEDLERQLHEYFGRAQANGEALPSTLNELRNRVIDGVVEKILNRWEQPETGTPHGLQDEVVERLIERVIGRLTAPR